MKQMKREIGAMVDSMESKVEEIEFDELDCCALYRAFDKNPEVVERLANSIEDNQGLLNLKRLLKVAVGAGGLKFSPEDNGKLSISQIIRREIERIMHEGEDDKDLTCGHDVDSHIAALEEALIKLEPTIH